MVLSLLVDVRGSAGVILSNLSFFSAVRLIQLLTCTVYRKKFVILWVDILDRLK